MFCLLSLFWSKTSLTLFTRVMVWYTIYSLHIESYTPVLNVTEADFNTFRKQDVCRYNMHCGSMNPILLAILECTHSRNE